MAVYFLVFNEPLGNAKHRARTYIGSCADDRLADRIAEHRQGRGAKITAAAVAKGIPIRHVLTLPGGWDEERYWKRWKNAKKVLKKHGVEI